MSLNPKERLLIEKGFEKLIDYPRKYSKIPVIYYILSKMPGGSFEDYVGKSKSKFHRRRKSHMEKFWGPHISEIWVKELENAINILREEQKYIKILNPSINCQPGETREEVKYRIMTGIKKTLDI
jgi:hypothetical protein